VNGVVVAPTRPGRATRAVVGRCAVLAVWATFGFGVVLGTFVVAPRPLGLESFAVLSGSMQPTLRVGDLVIDRRIRPPDARVGDIVTFRDPEGASRLLTHRVFRFRVRGAKAYVVTKGDANHSVERWTIPVDGTLGRVAFRIPKVGYLVMWAGGRFGRLALVAIPALLLGLFELRRIWLPKGGPDA
jgi:signal peptidase I